MAEYDPDFFKVPFRDLVLDGRSPRPYKDTRYEIYGFFADGHEITKRRFAFEADAKAACERIWKENRYGYKFRGQWVETHLLRCDYHPVEVNCIFKVRSH